VNKVASSDDFVVSPSRSFAVLSIVAGVIGWSAAFALTLERLHVLANPNATLSCDMNIFISCKSVMLTKQASLLGFPNPLIGLAAFVAPIVVGFAILAGAQFKQWFWRIYLVGISMGFIFVLWLFSQSTYVIHVLCPYCMLAWLAMIPLFWRTFIWAGAEGIIDVPVKLVGWFVRTQDSTWAYSLITEVLAALAIVFSFWQSWHLLFS
jgi:uncharacterized membrane protein